MKTATLDLSGLKCPLPVLHTRKALRAMPKGAVIEVFVTDPMAAIDIPNLLRETGDILRHTTQADGKMTFTIEKAAAPAG